MAALMQHRRFPGLKINSPTVVVIALEESTPATLQMSPTVMASGGISHCSGTCGSVGSILVYSHRFENSGTM